VQSAIVLVDSIAQGLDVVNAYAAEHLEIQTKNSKADAQKIRNAGAVFIGRFTPVSLGDYSAGSNHVLPTGGCACHSSGLSVQTFLKGVSFIEYNESAFTEIASNVITLANSEDLPAHGEAMSARFEGEK
jgi:histidinol dehydrogenase